MAINITYERTALGEFLERLPSLLLEYKKTKWSMEQEKKIREDDRNYKAAVSMYSDAKELYKSSKNELNSLEDKWSSLGLQLNTLNETYKSAGADVASNIYQGEATNWLARANHLEELTQEIEAKKDALEGVLYNDIRKADQVMKGGSIAGFGGGSDPTRWDAGDLGIEGYTSTYGDPSAAVQEFYDVNQGNIQSNLSDLEGTRLLNESRDKKLTNFSRKEAEQFLGGYEASSKLSSGLKQIYDLTEFETQENTPGVTPEMISEASNRKKELMTDIALEFSELLGEEADGLENPMDYYLAYEALHTRTMQSTATGGGEQGLRDFSIMMTSARKSYDYYISLLNSGDTGKANKIEALAKKYFGFEGMSFQAFITKASGDYSTYTLTPFEVNNQVLTKDQSIFDQEDLFQNEDE